MKYLFFLYLSNFECKSSKKTDKIKYDLNGWASTGCARRINSPYECVVNTTFEIITLLEQRDNTVNKN
jgi:hypothetical protein